MVLKGCVCPRPKDNTHRAKRQEIAVTECVDGSWQLAWVQSPARPFNCCVTVPVIILI